MKRKTCIGCYLPQENGKGVVNIKNVRLDGDIYGRCLNTAKGYYQMLRRRREIEEEIIHESPAFDGQPKGGGISDTTASKAERIIQRQEENERKILAVEKAWAACTDDCEREFIKLNLFERVQMQRINLPISERTMKRYRKRFLIRLAENLFEI